jgi:diguanylate cyclase (GGDEF)-like protein
MTALADQVQISRLSDSLTRLSLTFLLEEAQGAPIESSMVSGGTAGESAREGLLEDPRVRGRVLTRSELRERKALEARLIRQAFRDSLTGLANRALFLDRLNNALSRADRHHFSIAIVLVDLDDFKRVNDSWGHTAGDYLLVETADRLRSQLRKEDTAARLGGDEFAVLLEEGTGAENAVSAVERMLARIRAPLAVGGVTIRPTASAGVAVRTPGGCGAEELLQQADFALYAAKAEGKDGFRLFSSDMGAPSAARLELRTELERAVERQEIAAFYQPILSARTGSIVGFEALCRWRHPRRGLLAPADFLPVAEETGLVVPLGESVLHQAFSCLRRCDDLRPGSGLWLAVNVSGRQLREPGMTDTLLAALKDSCLEPERLVLDITEDVFSLSDESTLEGLKATRKAGIRLAIDDFGPVIVGQPILARQPADIVKMAKAFADSLDDSCADSAFADAMMGLARGLRTRVVAEGVERRDQLEKLISLGCDMWQGWYFSPALECAQFAALFRNHAA